MTIMYAEQKRVFEENLIRCELKVEPGSWCVTIAAGSTIQSKDGKCCALSPSLLGKRLDEGEDHQFLFGLAFHQLLKREYGISYGWIKGVLDGFDDTGVIDGTNSEYRDGYAWGQYMRAKYVQGGA